MGGFYEMEQVHIENKDVILHILFDFLHLCFFLFEKRTLC